MATSFKEILPAKGKRVRNDAFPNRPIDEKIPTKVKWTTYWQRRLRDKEIVIVGAKPETENVVANETVEDAEPQADNQEYKSSKKSKKSKA